MKKRTGIILAWDKNTFGGDDRQQLEQLIPYVDLVKVGMQAIYAEQTPNSYAVSAHVGSFTQDVGKGVMWDAKLADIENTVAQAVRNIIYNHPGVKMITVHAGISDGALRAAAKLCSEADVLALAVTVLTDISVEQCFRLFQRTPQHAVLDLATKAVEAGIRGIVCSPKEAQLLRREFGDDITLVIPGIRPSWAAANDQKRVMTPAQAAAAGADYIVVGRPILDPPKSMTPAQAAKYIRDELDGVVAPGSIVDKLA